MSDIQYEQIGTRLRQARRNRGLTQQQASIELGVSRPGVSGMETGSRGVSSLELHAAAKLYGCRVDWLLTGDTDAPPAPADTPDFDHLYRDASEASNRFISSINEASNRLFEALFEMRVAAMRAADEIGRFRDNSIQK